MSSSIPIFIYLARHSNIVQKWPDLHGVENLKNGMKMKMKENENKNENLKMAFNRHEKVNCDMKIVMKSGMKTLQKNKLAVRFLKSEQGKVKF